MKKLSLVILWSFAMAVVFSGCMAKVTPTAENSPLIAEPEAKKMRFISVVNFFPDDVPFMVNEAKRAFNATSVDNNAFLFDIYPSITLEEIAQRAKAFAELKRGLQGSGVNPGILIVCSVGQGWQVGRLPLEPMEYTVNQAGELNYRICMRDPKFRKHIFDSVVLLAKEHPAFFLLDDDFRSVNNSSYGAECFCDSHMKIYNAKMPRKFANAKELSDYLEAASPDDPCVKIFEAERRDKLLSHAKLIRDAIDLVDPSIKCGFCSGGGENIMAGDIARTLAGKNESFLRIHNANFMEMWSQEFSIVMYRGAYAAKMAGKVDYILDESDTHTRQRFAKSAISMHSHITGGILYGMSGGKLWLTNLENRDVQESNREYEAIVKANRRFYDALLAEMSHVSWQGPTTPIINERERYNPARVSSGVGFLQDMQVRMLNRYGIPGQYEFIGGDRLYLLNEQVAKAMTDAELKTVLSSKAVVDGHAALEIARRGMVDYLGCTPKLEKIFPWREELCSGKKHRFPFFVDGSVPNLTEVSPDAEIITRIGYAPGTEGKSAKLGPGMIIYKNPYGGVVVTRAMAVGVSRINDERPELKRILVDVFCRLDPASVPFYIGEDQPVHFRCGKHDKGGFLLAMVNLSFDAMTEIDLRTAEKVNIVEFLDSDGVYKPLKFTVTDRGIVVDKHLACYEPLVLRVK